MITVNNPSDCSGCTACMMVCNHKAISMQYDTLGFLYPHVDSERCVGCGLCEKVCSFSDEYDRSKNLESPIAFAARHKNEKEIETSRSGAAFVALSNIIIEQGGVVYGASFDHDFRVVHKRAITKKARDEFKGSKYAQSELGHIFCLVKADLQNGLKVMFSGTPCQTAGLNAFVGEKLRGNLFLVDVICHGVASPFVWADYLSYLCEKEGDAIKSVNFRDKRIFGWSGLHKESFEFEHKGIKTYNYTFYNPCLLRKSCNDCHFANLIRPSDITLGDLWGWEIVAPNFNPDDKGVSLVLCNSNKGIELFSEAENEMETAEIELAKCLQQNLKVPTPIAPHRNDFENDYYTHGFRYVMKKYGGIGLSFHYKRVLRSIKRIIYWHYYSK